MSTQLSERLFDLRRGVSSCAGQSHVGCFYENVDGVPSPLGSLHVISKSLRQQLSWSVSSPVSLEREDLKPLGRRGIQGSIPWAGCGGRGPARQTGCTGLAGGASGQLQNGDKYFPLHQ